MKHLSVVSYAFKSLTEDEIRMRMKGVNWEIALKTALRVQNVYQKLLQRNVQYEDKCFRNLWSKVMFSLERMIQTYL
jgi:hypothetical protein